MRLLIGAAAVGLLGLIGLRFKPAVTTQQAAVPVTVNLRCYDDSVHVSVVPWTVTVAQGGSVDWELDPSADANSMIVSANNPFRWPFQNGSQYTGDKKNSAKGRQMKANAHAQSPYQYSFTLSCSTPDKAGMPRKVVIDPEMIIN